MLIFVSTDDHRTYNTILVLTLVKSSPPVAVFQKLLGMTHVFLLRAAPATVIVLESPDVDHVLPVVVSPGYLTLDRRD